MEENLKQKGTITGLFTICFLLLSPLILPGQNTAPDDRPLFVKFDVTPKKLEKNRINFVTIAFKFKDEMRNLINGEMNINHVYSKTGSSEFNSLFPDVFLNYPPQPDSYSLDTGLMTYVKYYFDHRKFKKKAGTFKICYGLLPRKWNSTKISAWMMDSQGNIGNGSTEHTLTKEVEPLGKKQGRKVGQYAYDFTLLNHKRKPISLSDYQGKVILLDLCTMWCGPCKLEAAQLEKLYQSYKAQGFVIINVLTENSTGYAITPKQAAVWRKQYGMTFPVVADCFWGVYNAYTNFPRTRIIPLNILIDKNGKIRWKKTGYTSERHAELESKIQALLAE